MPSRSTTITPVKRRKSLVGRLAGSGALAWLLSATLHAAAFYSIYHMVYRQELQPRRVIIPEARLAPDAGASAAPQSSALEISLKPAVPAAASVTPSLDELVLSIDPAAPARPDEAQPLIDLPPAEQNNPIVNAGAPSPGPSAAPSVGFFGQPGNAYKVVYVVDASASLMIYMDSILAEMRRSIRGLLPTQRFHIILSRGGQVEEFAPRRLVPATGTYKAQAAEFLRVSGLSGKADPIEAMKRAFAAGPELIYFLSDGDYRDIEEELEKELAALNPRQETRITVIGFDPAPEPQKLLERIARRHGGNLRIVKPQGG